MLVSKPLWTRAAELATAIPILMIPTCATEAQERRICIVDLQLLGAGAGLLCTGEEEPQPQVVIDTACTAFEPVRYSRNDTEETKQAVREHNAAWDALCKGK
jgi:hypothetical protein